MNREEYNANEEINLVLCDQFKAGLWTALPAIITNVDYTKFTISAQPSIQGVIMDADNNESFIDMPLLVDVPILFPHGGGFNLTFPIKEGDECLVIFSSRCIDAWWQNGGIQKPMEARTHDLSDGFAVLAPYSQPKAKEVAEGFSQNSVILRSNDKSNFIELTSSGLLNIKITGDFNGDIGGNATIKTGGNLSGDIGGDVSIKAGGSIAAEANSVTIKASSITFDTPNSSFTGNVSIGGNLSINGNSTGKGSLTTSGPIKSQAEVTAGGINLTSHVHSGVESGPANTGGPQ